ncbi:MAG TPA: hypothetical protein VG295_02070 [Solirubrobacteraceae bacterium]|nr:hypothetical protein [Solirubrobacteraceae bacterium]
MSTESAVVAAATAAVFSPRTRETLRRGAVLGVAGALKVGDVVAGAARGAARGLRDDDAASSNGGERAPATRSRTGTAARSKAANSGKA